AVNLEAGWSGRSAQPALTCGEKETVLIRDVKGRKAGMMTTRSWTGASRAKAGILGLIVAMALVGFVAVTHAQDTKIVKTDTQLDGSDPGVKLFVREKMAEGNTRFADDNIVLFLHGATAPSTCDFDLNYKDYSWADWMVTRGYVVYMGDYRNYGY